MKKAPKSPTLCLSNAYIKDITMLWQLWVIREQSTATNLTLLYSWVVPAVIENSGWQDIETCFKGKFNSSPKMAKIELFKVSFYGKTLSIQSMITALLGGKTLQEAAEQEGMGAVPDVIINLQIRSSDYFLRPEIFLTPDVRTDWRLSPLPGPIHGCFVNQIFYLDKLAHPVFRLLQQDSSKLIGQQLLDTLTKDTTFIFTQGSAPRIGNIEWYRFELHDQGLNPIITFRSDPPHNGRSSFFINFASQVNRVDFALRLRCRLLNDQEVILDEMRDLLLDEEGVDIRFDLNSPVSACFITAWIKNGIGNWEVAYESEGTFIRNIGIHSKIVGTLVNTPGLSILKKVDRRDQSKAQQLGSYARTSSNRDTLISNLDQDPYVSSAVRAKEAMDKFFPVVSNAQFFLNGWDSRTEEHGQLSFVKWMLDVVSISKGKKLLLIDPYFDDAGIELIANARTTDGSITVVTCTQHRDTQACATDAGRSEYTSHSERLALLCKRSEVLLSGIDFTLIDLQSEGEGKKQLFHDRYFIFSNEEGVPMQGFHLSNSIQGATKSAPLLITPIPADIIGEIMSYIEELTVPKENTPASRRITPKTLYPFDSIATAKKDFEIPLFETVEIGTVLATILGVKSLKGLTGETLQAALMDLEFVSFSTSGETIIRPLTKIQVELVLSEFDSLDQEAFNQQFEALCRLRANYPDEQGTRIKTWCCEYLQGESKGYFKDHLFGVLRSFEIREELVSDRGNLTQALSGESFEKCAIFTHWQLQYFGPGFGERYLYTTTVYLLVKCFPSESARYFDSIFEFAKLGNWNQADPKIRAKIVQLNLFLQNFIGYIQRYDLQLQEQLLKSPHYGIRAVASNALLYGYKSNTPIKLKKPQLLEIIALMHQHLSDVEYRLSLAVGIAYTGVDLYEFLAAEWKSETSVERILKVLYGNLPYGPADAITDRFLIPLEKASAIESNFSFQHWGKIFADTLNGTATPSPNKDRVEFSTQEHSSLSSVLLKALLQQCESIQIATLQSWVNVLQQSRSIYAQPFVIEANYSRFTEACQKLLWLNSCFVYVEKFASSKILGEAIHQFRIDWRTEIARAEEWQSKKSYHRILPEFP